MSAKTVLFYVFLDMIGKHMVKYGEDDSETSLFTFFFHSLFSCMLVKYGEMSTVFRYDW